MQNLNSRLEGNSILDIGCYDGFLLSHVNAAEKIGIDLQTFKNVRVSDTYKTNS